MESEYWQQRWCDDQIRFHLDDEHPLLLKHWKRLGMEGQGRVFVPLCGKSNDMLWLRTQGHEVLGVEFSAQAIDGFCEQAGDDFIVDQVGVLTRYTAAGYVLLVGDYFALDRNLLGAVAGVYDRAALAALSAEIRKDYVSLQRELLPAGAQILLISLEFDQNEMDGPPFSVDTYEVKDLYGDWCEIELLDSTDTVSALPIENLVARECCYRLRVL